MVQAAASPSALSERGTVSSSEGRGCLLARLSLIEHIIERTCQRFRFLDQDADDFRSSVLLRLVENDYALLRGFRGESRWSTYLTAIIRNQARDFLVEKNGRWHFSKAAQEGTLDAMWLERLWRDGYSLEESIEYLVRVGLTRSNRQELRSLAEDLPKRTPRIMVREEALFSVESPSRSDARLESEAQKRAALRLAEALAQALNALDPSERQLIFLQYRQGFSLVEIASQMGLACRAIYTLRARCLRRLRRFLERRGVSREDLCRIFHDSVGMETEVDFGRAIGEAFVMSR